MITKAQRKKLEELIEDLVGAEIENSKGRDWCTMETLVLAERELSDFLAGITDA